jgi:hypothetical protein
MMSGARVGLRGLRFRSSFHFPTLKGGNYEQAILESDVISTYIFLPPFWVGAEKKSSERSDL